MDQRFSDLPENSLIRIRLYNCSSEEIQRIIDTLLKIETPFRMRMDGLSSWNIIGELLPNPNLTSIAVHDDVDIPLFLHSLERNPHVRLDKFIYHSFLNDVDASIIIRLLEKSNKFILRCRHYMPISLLPLLSHLKHLYCFYVENYEELAGMIENMPKLLSLTLVEDPSITNDRIFEVLKNHPSLKKVQLINEADNPNTILRVYSVPRIEKLLEGTNYESISFRCPEITPKMVRSLRDNSSLTSLSVNYKNKQALDLTRLLRALSTSTSPLRKLKIHGMRGDESWDILSLLERRGLEKLTLRIPCKKCTSLQLSFDPSTFSFNISCDRWHGESACSRFFLSLTKLRRLSVYCYELDKVMERMIRVNTCLKRLLYTGGPQGPVYFFPALERNFTLHGFSLGRTESFKDDEYIRSIMVRNRFGWTPNRHQFYSDEIRHKIKLLLSSQFFGNVFLPRELLFRIYSAM